MQSLHHYHLVVYPLASLSYGYHAVSALVFTHSLSCYVFKKVSDQETSDQASKAPMYYTIMAQLTYGQIL